MFRSSKTVLLIVIAVLFVVSYLTNRSDYPRPTDAYYVNDFADVLMQATRSTIQSEGERLYDWTQDEVDGGSQIVIATFEVETLSDIANYDKTDIYRSWKIGDDDMGVLVLFFFMEDSTTNELELVETQVEVGYRMEQYLTPTRLGLIVDDTIYNEDVNWLLDMAVANMLYELLTELYVNVYGYESFDYDMDAYYDYLLSYVPEIESEPSSMSLFFYLLSPYSSGWEKASTILPYAFLIIFGGSAALFGNRGGGGSSGGMGIFRRRQ